MPRVFVTGLAGYLGAEIGRAARAAGSDVSGTVFRRDVHDMVTAYRVDVRDAGGVAAAVAAVAPDAVVHTAYLQHGPEAAEVNVAGSENVARAAARAGARLVHVSTDMVFRGDAGRPLREGDAPDPVTPYGAAKAEAELRVAEADPGALVVRTSLLYGGEEPSPHERFALEAAAGERDVAFYEDELRCPVHVGELAEAIVALCDVREASGPLHLAGPESVSRLEFARLVVAAAGRDPDTLRGGPAPPGRPKDLTLDCSRAEALLGRPLRGVRQVLA